MNRSEKIKFLNGIMRKDPEALEMLDALRKENKKLHFTLDDFRNAFDQTVERWTKDDGWTQSQNGRIKSENAVKPVSVEMQYGGALQRMLLQNDRKRIAMRSQKIAKERKGKEKKRKEYIYRPHLMK